MSETCHKRKQQIPIKKCPIQICPHCLERYWNNELGIEFDRPSEDCLENPKGHRHLDWIEQWETIERKQHNT